MHVQSQGFEESPVHAVPSLVRDHEFPDYDQDAGSDDAMVDAIMRICDFNPFLIENEWLVACDVLAEGVIPVASYGVVDGHLQQRRWDLTIREIYFLIQDGAIRFPQKMHLPNTPAF